VHKSCTPPTRNTTHRVDANPASGTPLTADLTITNTSSINDARQNSRPNSDDRNSGADENAGDTTSNTPFIGVASHDTGLSVLAYYGVENHSKWVFTPLFRGAGMSIGRGGKQPVRPDLNSNSNR
jgi:hypothetical protein